MLEYLRYKLLSNRWKHIFTSEVCSRGEWTQKKNLFCCYKKTKRGVRALDGARKHDLRFRVGTTKRLFGAIRLVFRNRLVLRQRQPRRQADDVEE